MNCVYLDYTHPLRQAAWDRLGFERWLPAAETTEEPVLFALHAQEIRYYLVPEGLIEGDWEIGDLLNFVDAAVGVHSGVVLYSGGIVEDYLEGKDFDAFPRCWVYDQAVPMVPEIVVNRLEEDELYSHSERMKKWFMGLPTWEQTVVEWFWGAAVFCSGDHVGLQAYISKTSLLPDFPFREGARFKLGLSRLGTPILADDIDRWLDFARRIREHPELLSGIEVLTFKNKFLETDARGGS